MSSKVEGIKAIPVGLDRLIIRDSEDYDRLKEIEVGFLLQTVTDEAILEVPSLVNLPALGSPNRIYVTLDTGISYRWNGVEYVLTSVPEAPIDSKSYLRKDKQWEPVVLGTEYTFMSDESESTTTSTTFVSKVLFTSGVLPSGTYRVSWYHEISNNTKDKITESCIMVDTTEIGCSEHAAKTPLTYTGAGGFSVLNLANGIHTFDILFRAVTNTAYMARARIELSRIS